MSSNDGDDPTKKSPDPATTLTGVAPQQPGAPAPSPSTHGRARTLPPPRSGTASQTPPFRATPYPGAQPPFGQQQPPPQGQPPQTQPPAQPPQPYAQPQPPYDQHGQPHAGQPPHPDQAYMPPTHGGPQGPTHGGPQGPTHGVPSVAPTGMSGPTHGGQHVQTQPGVGVPSAAQHVGIPGGELLQSESSPIEKMAEAVGDVVAEVPGRFVGFLKISSKRAFRLRIEPTEVLPDERDLLAATNPPVLDANLQAFLAWRRSVLFLVATILTVLSIMGLIDVFIGKYVSSPVRFVKLLPTLAEVAFCVICWLSLRHWTAWRKQRKWLLFGWLLFMLTPFVVFMYPLITVLEKSSRAMSIAQLQELGWNGVYNRAIAPFAFAMIAMLQLAPKVISLMPGLIRSSMVVKLLFPGSSAPGWLIVFCAPLYAMIAYAFLVIPYQFTGEPWFMFGVFLIVVAQVLVMRSGFALAKPLTEEEAIRHIKVIRGFYLFLLITAAISIIGGLGLLVKLLNMKWTTVITTILKFESNVMILTTIGADLVVTNLDRARGYTAGREQIERETEEKISAFVGLNAPPS